MVNVLAATFVFSAFLCVRTIAAYEPNKEILEPSCKNKCCDETKKELQKSLSDFNTIFQKYQSRTKAEIADLKRTLNMLKKEVTVSTKPGSINEPAKSCKEIFQMDKTSINGPYYLQTDTTDKKSVAYCHMESIPGCGSGGWTLLMKTDGNKNTFHFNSNYWTNKITYNKDGGRFGFNNEETKLETYWSTPFTKLCLGMQVSGKLRWITLVYTGSSLYDVIADGSYKSSNAGRASWKSLISGSSIQRNCNKEGFNIDTSMKVRIGFVGNNENDCRTNDSRIGFGAGGGPGCGTADDSNTCGNNAGCGADRGNMNIKAFGYILVQ